MTTLNWIIIGIMVGMYLIQTAMSLLNYAYRNTPIPHNVKEVYDEERYNQWLLYTMENFRFSLITRTIRTVAIVALLLLGGFAYVSELTQFGSEWLSQGLFLVAIIVISTIVDLPFDYYQTFSIEERFGFNRSTKKTFFVDAIKNVVLSSALLFGVYSFLYFIYSLFADQLLFLILGVWAGFSVLFILLAVFNGFFVRLFNKLTPLEEGSLKTRINELASQAGFTLKRVFVMDASKRSAKLNAFFTGLGKTKEIVLFDTLIDKMSEEQVLSVMAHEIAHYLHKDVYRLIVENIVIFAVYASVLGFVFGQPDVMSGFGFETFNVAFGLLLFSFIISPISFVVSIPRMYFSRVAEFKADAYSATKIDKSHMIQALKVLAKESLSNLTPHPWYVKLYYSHPPMSERIAALENA
jgi:STE24 endopeptidase